MKILLTVLLALLLSACSSAAQPVPKGVKLAPVSQLLPEVQKAPVQVREAYQFASANPELMKKIPCYCGCGSIGHTSNLDCYIKEVSPDGKITFETHALG
jgi:hypothetical protein